MRTQARFGDEFFGVLLCGGLALISAATLWQTRLSGSGHIGDGSYQRGYEARFEAQLPGRRGLNDMWAAAKLALFAEPARGAILGADGWLFTEEEFLAPASDFAFLTRLKAAQTGLARHNIQLVPIVVPDKARMAADLLPYARSEAFERRYDAALAAVARADLAVLDLRAVLGQSADGAHGFLRSDTHWSPIGARRVAGLVAQHLQAADRAEVPFRTEVTGDAPLEADLMRFVQTGTFAPKARPAPERIQQYETIGGAGGLFEAPAPEVALVGTSFSARQDFHFEGFLKSALQADVLNLAEVGGGPFAPMHKLITAADAGALPDIKYVIWEIPERYIPVRREP